MNNKSETNRDSSLPKLNFSTAVLGAFIVAVPWLYEGTTDQHRATVILVSLPFLLLTVFRFRGENPPALLSNFAKLGLGAMILGLVLSASFAERSTIAWLRVLELCWAGTMVYCVARNIASRPVSVFYIIAAIACAYCISNVRLYFAWIQVSGDPRALDWTFAIPGYFHFRNLGFAAAPALVGLAWLPFSHQVRALPEAKKRLVTILLWLVSAVGWGVLAWSGSRAGVLSIFVGVTALAYFSKEEISKLKLVSFSFSACVIGGAISIPFTPHQGASWGGLRIIGRATSVLDGGTVDEYSSGRITVWLDGLSRCLDNWLLGIGPDQYASQPRLPNRLLEPHNAVVDVALESGLLGVLGLCLLVVFVFRILRVSKRGGACAVVGALVLTYGVYSMVDGTFVWTLPLAYISVLLGALFGLASTAQKERAPLFSFEGAIARSVLPVALLCFVVFYYVYFQSQRLQQAAPDSDSMAARLLYRFPATTWGVNRWLAEWEKGGTGDLEAWYDMLIDESPAPYFYRIEYAYFLIRQNRLAEAREELVAALAIAPEGVIPRLEEKHGPILRKLNEVL